MNGGGTWIGVLKDLDWGQVMDLKEIQGKDRSVMEQLEYAQRTWSYVRALRRQGFDIMDYLNWKMQGLEGSEKLPPVEVY